MNPMEYGAWLMRPALLTLPLLLGLGCTFDIPGEPQPPNLLRLPGAMAISGDGERLYVVGTNFDRKYRGGVVQVIDVAALDLMLGDPLIGGPVETLAVPFVDEVEIGSFGGLLAVADLGDGAERLFVPVREYGTVAVLDWSPAGGLTCYSSDGSVTGRNCEPAEIALLDPDAGLMDDPFSVAVVSRDLPGRTVNEVFVGSISDQRAVEDDPETARLSFLARMSVGVPEAVTLESVGRLRLRDLAMGPTGRLFGVGVSIVSDVATARVVSFDPAGFDLGLPRESVSLFAALGALDGVSLQFSGDGSLLYVVTRSPSALAVFDASGETAADLVLLRTVALPESPSRMLPIATPNGELVAVSVTGADTLAIVDPVRGEIVSFLDGTHCAPDEPCPAGSTEPREKGDPVPPAEETDLGRQPFGMAATFPGVGGVRLWLGAFGTGEVDEDAVVRGTLRAIDIPDLTRPWEAEVRVVLRSDPEDFE